MGHAMRRGLTACLLMLVLLASAEGRSLRRKHQIRTQPGFKLATLVSQAGGVLSLEATEATITTDGAAAFVAASGQFLSIADNAALSMGDIDFSLVGWAYLETNIATMALLSRQDTSSDKEYFLRYDNATDRFHFSTSNVCSSTGQIFVLANTFGSPSIGTWHFVVVWHNAAADTINIVINDGTVDSTATGGVAPSDCTPTTRIGSVDSAPANPWNGRSAHIAMFKKVLSAAEITFLFNAGLSRPCAEHAAFPGLLTNEVACWDLLEPDGTRFDSVGSSDLTATNGPGTAKGPFALRALDGAPVILWSDTSQGFNNASQATQLVKPIWVANCQNGRGCVRFDGVDDFLDMPARAEVAFTAPFVVRRNVASVLHTLVGDAVTTDTLGLTATNAYLVNDGTTAPTFGTNASTAVQLLTWQHADSTVQSVFRNGVLDASGVVNTTINVNLIGERIGAASQWDGDMATVLWMPSVLDATARQRIERCLMERYGITPNTGACQ